MDMTISIVDNGTADDLRSLRTWLLDADGLRGRVDLLERPPLSGELGPVLDAILVALGPGGAVTGVIAGVLSWIRHRTSDVNLKVTQTDGRSFEVSARRVRRLDADDLRLEIDQLSHVLDTAASIDGPSQSSGPDRRLPLRDDAD
jgi:hypothetical protein